MEPDSLDNGETIDHRLDHGKGRGGLSPGTMLGQYRILRLLGRGGMGEVYEVEHTTLEKRYALKLIPEELLHQRGFVERFRREAKVMAHLDHPHIVKVDEFGETEGKYWLRMELVEGIEADGQEVSTLAELAEMGGGKIEQGLLARVLDQVLEGLNYAHGKGTVHRDLKPANILLSGNNLASIEAKISDFGLVRLVGEEWVRSRAELSVSLSMSLGDKETVARADESGTSTRSILGTYEYMSPEQKRGEDADARSDLYAVGLIIHRLLTGQRELSYDLPSQIDNNLVRDWDEVVRRALRPVREERFSSASEMLELLRKVEKALAVGLKEKQRQTEEKRREAERKKQEILRREEEKKRRAGEERRREEERCRQAEELMLEEEKNRREKRNVLPARRRSRKGIAITAIIVLLLAVGYALFKTVEEKPSVSSIPVTGSNLPREVWNEKPTGYVNDFAKVISPSEKAQLTVLIEEVEKKTTAEIAVVTVPTTAPLTKEQFAVKLFERWGIGKKGKDNGVLILISLKERAWKIETGYGLEGALPDVIVSEIGRKIMVPYFKKGEFGKGLLAGTQAIAAQIVEEYNVTLSAGGGRSPSLPVDMVLIPAGEFLMGSNDGDSDEQPVHKVYVDAFYMDKYEVTVGQFRKFVEETGYRTDAEKAGWAYAWTGSTWEKKNGTSWRNPGFSQTDNHPVVDVSWNDAVAYAKWAGKRLPTEAEWEKAARGGLVGKKYPWGDEAPDGSQDNFADKNTEFQWSDKMANDGYRYTAPVGSYPANGYGLYDMAGNVWNWVADWYDSGYYENSPYKNPKGPNSGTYRVLRGGSWNYNALSVRAANRNWVNPDYRDIFIGFRCARTP